MAERGRSSQAPASKGIGDSDVVLFYQPNDLGEEGPGRCAMHYTWHYTPVGLGIIWRPSRIRPEPVGRVCPEPYKYLSKPSRSRLDRRDLGCYIEYYNIGKLWHDTPLNPNEKHLQTRLPGGQTPSCCGFLSAARGTAASASSSRSPPARQTWPSLWHPRGAGH